MGKFNAGSNNVYQDLSGVLGGGIWGMPAYFNGTLYCGAGGDAIRGFQDYQRQALGRSDRSDQQYFSLSGNNKFITPTIVNGKVYVGTTNSVEVFGLLP